MLFSKALKARIGIADKGCVSTLAHTMMTAARSADSGMAGPGELDRYSYAEGSGNDRPGLTAWEGVEPDMSRMGRRAGGSRGRGLHGQLVQQLGQMIVSGDLGADRPLVPEEIGQRFEVSRTVVRESLRVLEAKGLVSARPNVGTRIRPVQEWNLLDPDVIEWRAQGPLRGDQARELAELRQAFEPLAAHLVAERGGALPEAVRARLGELADMLAESAAAVDAAAYARIDAEFHALLLQATDNRMLEHLSAVVYGALEITGVRAGCEALPANARSHAELVEYILAGDGPAAAELSEIGRAHV